MASAGECHVMLSYNWNKQDLVKKIYEGLDKMGFPVWMDIEGGIQGNINDSMAYGVDNASVVCCFMSPEYQESANCKKELNYADDCRVPILPCMTTKDYKARGWLGLITAGLLWIDFKDEKNVKTSIESLAKEIVHRVGNIKLKQPKIEVQIDLTKKPGRAFRHTITGQFLAESGKVKFHPQSGNRSNLVLRDTAEKTSYWIEERKEPNSEIYYYKNFETNGYLGYDPNGDYTYTKGQHYGAEEWMIKMDDKSTNGERAVVIFAAFGKKYLAIKNGKLTGLSQCTPDCIWVLA